MSSLSSSVNTEILSEEGIFLHACCGPCAEYPIRQMEDLNIPYALYYYNPNIHPKKEWHRRLESLAKLAQMRAAHLYLSEDFDQETCLRYGDSPERCIYCYETRMEKVAAKAADLGYKYFTTTLLISPYQHREAIIKAGEKAAARHNLSFLDADWRDKFREGQCLAKEDDLYRQKYCGCIISLSKSKFKEKIARSLKEFSAQDLAKLKLKR